MTNYYVYYRIDPAQLAFCRHAVGDLFSKIENATGVRGRWLRRRDESTTYLEVYEGVRDAEAFDVLLEAECLRLGWQQFLAAGAARRREIFIAAETHDMF